MLFSAPLEVARTKAWTFAPSSTSASVRCEPMNPSAPVTSTVRPRRTRRSRGAVARAPSSVHTEAGLFEFAVEAMSVEIEQPSLPLRRSAVRSGVATGVSILAVSGAAALAGAYLAHKFGRERRDRRLPRGVRRLPRDRARGAGVPARHRPRPDARGRRRTGCRRSSSSYASALLAIAVPCSVLAAVFSRTDSATCSPETSRTRRRRSRRARSSGSCPPRSRRCSRRSARARSRRATAICRSGRLRARRASRASCVFVALADSHGLVSLAWGLALNGALAASIPLFALLLAAPSQRQPRRRRRDLACA